MKKSTKRQKQKEKIFSLAEDATSKIIKNRLITWQINNYSKHIELIKTYMNKFSGNSKITDNSSKKLNNILFIKNEFNTFFTELKSNIEILKSDIKKIKQKYESNNDKYFNVNLSDNEAKVDSFILSYSLIQKINIIKKLKESIHLSKDYNIFQEPKRESLISIKTGEENIDIINEDLQKYAFYEIKQFNKYYNRTQRKLKKRNYYRDKIKIFNEIINYFNENNQSKFKEKNNVLNKNQNNYYIHSNTTIIKNKKPQIKKIYQNEPELNINKNLYSSFNNTDINPSTNDTEILNSGTSNSHTNNNSNNILYNSSNLISLSYNKRLHRNSLKKKNKLQIPTVEELFDLANNEGEKEAIIDDELHSDEDIVFQPKVKQPKKLLQNYLPKIKERIPNISLSLIEYNKMKIMNDADLYSYNRRQEQRGNAEENIKIMKKKIKIIKRRLNINQKKLETIKNFVQECENDYYRLKAMKVQMSMKEKVTFMKKEFYTQNINDKIDEEDELNYQKELDEYLNDPELNDPYFEQFQNLNLETDITHRDIETQNNIIKKINNENLEENKKDNNGQKKYDKIKTHRERKKEKIKRANSK
mgnify:FL=1